MRRRHAPRRSKKETRLRELLFLPLGDRPLLVELELEPLDPRRVVLVALQEPAGACSLDGLQRRNPVHTDVRTDIRMDIRMDMRNSAGV